MAEVGSGEWIEINRDEDAECPVWGAGDDRLYYTSMGAGSRDLWMQPIDAATKRPAGEPQLIRRFPSQRHSLGLMGTEDRQLAFGGDSLIFLMSELGGEIWILEPR